MEYDEIGRRVKLSATGLTDTTYSYDQNSRLTGVTQGSQMVALTYDNAGRRTSLTYPNGVVTSYGYDNANRLLTINHVKTPTTIEALTYQYDAASNRSSLNRANAAASLIPTAVSSNTYDAANEQTQFNGVTQTFDANGNLTNDGTNAYTWDARNRLTGISGGVAASFVYDGLGRRKSKSIGGTNTGFWYDGYDVLAELNGGTTSLTYIRGLNIDEPYIRKGTSDELYQVDALGSSIALTNGAGSGQTTYTYEPFGNTIHAGSASTNSFQYTGRENDGADLYYYRARYYRPNTQRFISEDPLGFGGGVVNLYSYAANAPSMYSDPEGLKLYVSPDLKQAMKELAKSKRGRELILELDRSPDDFFIVSSPNSQRFRVIPGTRIAEIDPVFHPDVCTTKGPLPVETEIGIAHEIGHLIGFHEDGPGRMSNILKNENPVRRDLRKPLRTQYEPPPCKRK